MIACLVATRYILPQFEVRPKTGCYWTDAMLPYVGCQHTGVDGPLGFLLTLPFYWLSPFMPLIVVGGPWALLTGRLDGVLPTLAGAAWCLAFFLSFRAVLNLVFPSTRYVPNDRTGYLDE
jgi:hypothetical protein